MGILIQRNPTKQILAMKFAAALLFATATASYVADEPVSTTWTKSYATQYKKIDVDAIVTELNKRNEQRVRAVRDEIFATVRGRTLDTGDAIDELIAVFEADILALREAIQQSRDNKRAEMSAANAAMKATQDTLLAEILLADMYYDHTRIAKLLDNDGKEAALTWDDEPIDAPETVGESYLSWNAREPAERVYNELYTADARTQYPSYHGYQYGQHQYG